MSSEFGRNIRVTVFGQSHGKAIGVTVDNLPAGEPIDFDELQRFLSRRRPGGSPLSTARSEADMPVFLSGIADNKTCGSPLCAIIENTDARSSDYAEFIDKPRPSHADYVAAVKWGGQSDMRGGGHFSGRLTAPLCIAGGIAKQILAGRSVFIGAHLSSIGSVKDAAFPLLPQRALLEEIGAKPFPVIDDTCGERMKAEIAAASKEADSVGGSIECAAIGIEAGLGSPMFDGVESRLSAALFGIPAVRGVAFGNGFECTALRGSVNNDPFIMAPDGTVATATNNSGGIQGGITNGMPLIVSLAIKPTPSIGRTQRTVSLSLMEETELIIHGRHDPCIAHRAVPVVEAVTALVLLDEIMEGK